MITLYLAEDQSMLNSALTQLLELEDDLHVVGSAVDGINAGRSCKNCNQMSQFWISKCQG